jgi:peptidoglycan-N-acetylglucosamine deacetylase
MPIARLLFYLFTAGGVALAVGSWLHEPPPLWVALLSLFLYVGYVTGGVIFARFSMFADVVTAGPRNARGVALTFDDGPDPRSTPAILDMLDEAGAKATFFVIGRKAEKNPEIIKEISSRGHGLGLHSYNHERTYMFRSPWFVKRDLERCAALIDNLTGARPTLFRPPIGHVSPSIGKIARELELDIVGWSARGVDGWSGARPSEVAEKVKRRLRDGAIVLLHDASERGDFVPASLAALPAILAEADRLQLPIVRVDSWLEAGDEAEREAAHDLA